MKNNLLLLFLAVSFFVNAQSNYQRKLFQTVSSNANASVIYSNEYNTSTFIVRVIYPGAAYTAYSDITKFTTTTGNVTSSKTFSIAGYDLKVLDVVKNNQMLYMTAMITNSAGTLPCIIKYNLSTNTTSWRKTLSINNEVFRAITYDNAKNIYLLGNYYNSAASKTDLMVAKMDTNGVLFWTKTYGEFTLNQNQNQGGIVFNGNRALYISNAQPNGITESSILRLDSAGNILTSKTLSNTFPRFFQNFLAILKGKLVSIDRSVNTTSTSSSVEGPILIRTLDTNLTAIITKTLSPDITINDVYSNNTNLIVSGPVATTGYGYKSIRFDSLLTVIGSKHFSKIPVPALGFNSLTTSFIHSSNSSFHFFNPYNSDTVFVAKTDPFENVGCKDSLYPVTPIVFNYTTAAVTYTSSSLTFTATTITIPVGSATYSSTSFCAGVTTGINSVLNSGLFSIYPNPANSVLTITSDSYSISKFIITEVTGKEVMNGTAEDNIDVSHLRSGIYFISVYDENKRLAGTKKFVKN